MLTRRLILTGLTATLATPALSQGKKSSSSPTGLSGPYDAHGLNTDGSKYTGTVDITEQGDAVEMTWLVNGDTIHGSGTREGRVLTIDWGGTTPVIYVVMPDGTLHGTWDDGLALEKLTRR